MSDGRTRSDVGGLGCRCGEVCGCEGRFVRGYKDFGFWVLKLLQFFVYFRRIRIFEQQANDIFEVSEGRLEFEIAFRFARA